MEKEQKLEPRIQMRRDRPQSELGTQLGWYVVECLPLTMTILIKCNFLQLRKELVGEDD